MLKINYSLFLACMLLLQTVCNTTLAQSECNDGGIILTATSSSQECGNGIITVTVSGNTEMLDLDQVKFSISADKPFATYPRLGDNSWIINAPKGIYTVRMQAFCYEKGEPFVFKNSANVEIKGDYTEFDPQYKTRKSMQCISTGQVTVEFKGGKPPYSIDFSQYPPEYKGEINFDNIEESKIEIGGLPEGTYSMKISESCGTAGKIAKFTIKEIDDDFPSLLHSELVRTNGTGCSVIPYNSNNISQNNDDDTKYYWNEHADLYYEYCYVLKSEEPIDWTNFKDWKALPNDKRPKYEKITQEAYADFCNNSEKIVSYIRPKGCENGTPQRIEHYLSSNVCNTTFNTYPALEGKDNNTARLQCNFTPPCYFAYPAKSWAITGEEKNETADFTDDVLTFTSNGNEYVRGNTYTITITDNAGKTYTGTWIPEKKTTPQEVWNIQRITTNYSAEYSSSCPNEKAYIRLRSNSGNILPKTKITYISGAPDDFFGMKKNLSYEIPDNHNSIDFYPTSFNKDSKTANHVELEPGTYRFKITLPEGTTPPQGVELPGWITLSEEGYTYNVEFTKSSYYQVSSKAHEKEAADDCSGLKITPACDLKLIAPNGTTTVSDVYFRIASGVDNDDKPVLFQPDPVKAGETLKLTSFGKYVINILTAPYSTCVIDTFQIDYQDRLQINFDQSSFYHCAEKEAGTIIIKEPTTGIKPYTYTVADVDKKPLGENSTGIFPAIGKGGNDYYITVKDQCGTIAYTTPVDITSFCENSTVQLNCIALGDATYKWKGPNLNNSKESMDTIQKPKPIVPHPDSNSNVNYQITVQPQFCDAITWELAVNVMPAPELEIPGNINLCVGSGDQNLEKLSGIKIEDDCVLKWYDEDDKLIATPNVYPTTNIGTTRYYVSKAYKNNGCASDLEPIRVIVGSSDCCPGEPSIHFETTTTSITGIHPVTSVLNLEGTATQATLTVTNGSGSFSTNVVTGSSTAVTYTPSAQDAGKTITITATTDVPEGCLCEPATATWDITFFLPEYFVKVNGTGDGNGSSWENAMSNETFAGLLSKVPDSVTFHIAAGTYHPVYGYQGSFSENITDRRFEINSSVTLIGGYPANAQTGSVSEPEKHKTLFDGNIDGEMVYNLIYSYLPSLKTSLNGLYLENAQSNTITCYSNESELYLNNVTVSNSQNRAINAPNSSILTVENSSFYKNNGVIGAYNSTGKTTLNNVRLEGNFGNTVIDCGTESLLINQVNAKDNTTQLLHAFGKDVTITNNSIFENNQSDYNLIQSYASNSFTITDSKIINNISTDASGIYFSNSNANVSIERTVFDGNQSNGSACICRNYSGSSFYEYECECAANLYVSANTATINNCIFRNGKSKDNQRNAVYISCSANSSIANSTFENNSAKRIIYLDSKTDLINSTFTGNKVQHIAYINSGNSSIHNTITGNECTDAVFYFCGSGEKTLTGNIILGNKGLSFNACYYTYYPKTKHNILLPLPESSSWTPDATDIIVPDTETADYLQVLDGAYDESAGLFSPTLQANGGFTPTIALTGIILPNGKHINSLPTAISGVTTDQRGVKRNGQSACIGAYEIGCGLPEVAGLSITSKDIPCRGEAFTLTLTGLPGSQKNIYRYAWSFPDTEVEVAEKSTADTIRIKVPERIPTLPVTVTLTGICGNDIKVNETLNMSGMNEVSISGIDAGALYCRESAAITLNGTPEGGIFKVNGIESVEFDPSKLAGNEATIRYEVLDAESGCYSYEEKTVRLSQSDPELNLDIELTEPETVCNGGQGAIGFTITGGAGEYLYSVNGGAAVAAGTAAVELSALNPGEYLIEAWLKSDECAGKATRAVTLKESGVLQVGYIKKDISCAQANDGSITFTVNGWADSHTAKLNIAGQMPTSVSGEKALFIFNELAADTYTFEVTDKCGNTASQPVTIQAPAAITGIDTQVACDSYTWIDGITYTENNRTATHTLTGISGCDSVVTLNLTINRTVYGTDTQVACDSYTWIDGITYTESNHTATHTLTAQFTVRIRRSPAIAIRGSTGLPIPKATAPPPTP